MIRTHDLLLRRQLLYPAELPDQNEKGSEQYLHTAYCLFFSSGDRIPTPAGDRPRHSRPKPDALPIIPYYSRRGDRIRTCDPLVPNQMRYRAAPLPEVLSAPDFVGYRAIFPSFRKAVEEAGFEPAVPLRVRQFSKLLVSATHPSLLLSVLGCKYRGLPFRKTNISVKKLYQKLQIAIFEKV